jgi:mono/diheme cytochrome c family protein
METKSMLARAFLSLVSAAGWAFAQKPAAPDIFRDQVQPILQKNCFGCHNAKLKQGGLDLSSREGLLRGSEHGPVVVAGNPGDSQLYKLVAHITEPAMPFKGKKLEDEAIAKISEWIKAGVPYGGGVIDPEAISRAEAEKHWAFRRPVRPVSPAVQRAGWSKNPIDAFIAAEQEKRGLTALPEADKRTLLRRVYIDLTGLPPTQSAAAAFLADASPQAYDKVVDQLLASPQYGERWGRHWLDIWRYSDWYGYRAQNQVRYSQRHIWRWRDWTVESLNENKPYDRMVMEMLAGDEMAPTDPKVLRATGYLARNWYMFNRNVWLQDTVEYTSAGFLGLTLKCARCHTHKYDPIPHADYYRMRAFFEPHEVRTDRVPGQADTTKDGLPRVYDADTSRTTYRFIRGNENNPDKSEPLEPSVPQLFGKTDLKIVPVSIPPEAVFPDGRTFVAGDMIAQAKAAIEKAEADLKKANEKREAPPVIKSAEKRVEAAKAALPALEARLKAEAAVMATPAPANAEQLAEEARKLERQANSVAAEADVILGQYELEQAKGDDKKLAAATRKLEAAVKALKEPAEGYTPIGPRYPTTSSGRRLALAGWIAAKDNPLTARVAINHMWLRHFGKPLVSTVFNFGKSGKAPSHPELLDWLAVEFMERNWDMKAIHRLMVTSKAYKIQSSGWNADAPQVKIDPDNIYLWHANVRRLEAEAVRDSLLALAGKLDLTMGGPEIDETKGEDVYRRSIYFRTAPDLQMDMLKVFDVASPNECFQRSESIVPQQGLALANSRLSLTIARELTSQLSPMPVSQPITPTDGNRSVHAGAAPSDEEFTASAFDRILGRPVSKSEMQESLKYLSEQAELYRNRAKLTAFKSGPAATVKPSEDPQQRARESLVHVLLNHNDTVTIR